jgi:hypothetical protein
LVFTGLSVGGGVRWRRDDFANAPVLREEAFKVGFLRTNCVGFTGTGSNLIEEGEVIDGELCPDELDSSGIW